MKRMLFAGAVALGAMSFGVIGQALAADLPQPYTPPPPRAPATYVPVVAPVYNWGGIYVGVNGGYGFGDSTFTPGTGSFSVNGGLVGGTLGANYQMGQFVMGIEGDFDWSGMTGSTTTGTAAPCLGLTCTTANNWLGTVRGRLGFAWDRVLFFGTAGAAFGDIKASVPGASSTSTEPGWTAGAGLEFAITENLTAKVEYLFVDLTNGSCSVTACGTTAAVKFDASVARAGLNFKFNGF